MAILYKGFSTFNRSKKFRVTDFDLVKQDLINHFNVRKGEKLMQPNFGTIIWNVLFEPLDDYVRQAIIDDVKTIVGYDPRVVLQNITINDKDYGIQIELDLLYKPGNQLGQLSLKFDKTSETLTTNR